MVVHHVRGRFNSLGSHANPSYLHTVLRPFTFAFTAACGYVFTVMVRSTVGFEFTGTSYTDQIIAQHTSRAG